MSFDPSPARRGFDALLARYPHFDVLNVVDPSSDEFDLIGQPWVIVVLGQPSETSRLDPMHGRAYARWEFAIWRSTGAVHSMRDGEASDDPIITL